MGPNNTYATADSTSTILALFVVILAQAVHGHEPQCTSHVQRHQIIAMVPLARHARCMASSYGSATPSSCGHNGCPDLLFLSFPVLLFLAFCYHTNTQLDLNNSKILSARPKPHPSKPHPCNMPQAKTEVALQFSECCAAEVALQHSLFCSADVILTRSCAAASEKLQRNIEKAPLQESGAFLPLSCGFQAPTFRRPR